MKRIWVEPDVCRLYTYPSSCRRISRRYRKKRRDIFLPYHTLAIGQDGNRSSLFKKGRFFYFVIEFGLFQI